MKQITVILLFILFFISLTVNAEESKENIKITIVYDNYVFQKGTKSDWGFSCLVECGGKTILFDTGTQGEILMHNVEKLNIDLKTIDMIVLSHVHRDHTGGLMKVLDQKSDVSVYYPHSFPQKYTQDILLKEAVPIAVKEPVKLFENAYLTGEISGPVNEQSLVLNTSKGLVVIVGCSHPGIVKILKKAQEIWNKKIYLVLGGFHLMSHSKEQVENIADEFKMLGVEQCGATHCTGDGAIKVFKNKFGDNYVSMGVGKVITVQ